MAAPLELFRGIIPFVAVAEERSFRKAAVRLGVSPAAVSKAVQTLEAAVGVQLFLRGARSVELTGEGRLYFERCQAAVAAVQGAREAIAPAQRVPEGEMVVSLPFVLTGLVARGLSLLRARYPRLTFRVTVTDRLSKLSEESVDVALRIGWLADSSLVSRKLRATQMYTVASPAYLARRGLPARLEDLESHDLVAGLAPSGRPYPWLFRGGPRPVKSVLDVDHGPMLLSVVEAGLGISQAFDFLAEEPLREGRLIRLFPDETADGPDVHAVCAPGRRATPRVRVAFRAFADTFATAGS